MRVLPFSAIAAVVIIAAPRALEAQASMSADRTVPSTDSVTVASTIATEHVKQLDRCTRTGVYCLTRLQLDANPSARLSDLLAHANGLFRHCDGSTSNCTLVMHPAAGTGACTPSYYVDGTPFPALLDNPLAALENALLPSDIQKIEVYRSEQRPRELGGGQWRDCGAIVIWRR